MKELKEQLQYAITHSEEPEKARYYLEKIIELEKKYENAVSDYESEKYKNNIIIKHIKNNFCNNNNISDCWHSDMKEILNILKKEDE